MRSVRLLFVTAWAVYAYYLLSHAQYTLIICYCMCTVVQCALTISYRMRSVHLQLVPACAVLYTLTKHKVSGCFLSNKPLTICYCIRRVRLQFATICAEYAYILLPHAQDTLIIRYRMHRVRLQFATACLEYANKANHAFQLNPVKTNEKSEKSKKPILTHSSGPRGNLKQVFFVPTFSAQTVTRIGLLEEIPRSGVQIPFLS